MIRHQQAETAMPDRLLVVEPHRRQDVVASTRAAQLILSGWRAIDSNGKPTALGGPLWRCMRQLLAGWQIHVWSVTSVFNGANTEGGKRQVSSQRSNLHQDSQ